MGGHVLIYCTMRDVWSQLKTLAEVDARIAEVEAFNQVGMVMSVLCDTQAELFRDSMVSYM